MTKEPETLSDELKEIEDLDRMLNETFGFPTEDLDTGIALDVENDDDEEEIPDHMIPVPGRKRMSVSAYRDYRRCPAYYKLKRIDKLEEEKKHYLAAGTLIHNAFYMAYGYPVEEYDENADRMKLRWKVTGDFRPQDAIIMFELLWDRRLNEDGEKERDDEDSPIPTNLQRAFRLLDQDTDVVENFVRGRKKALKADSQEALREGWKDHYGAMLAKAMQKPLPYPVVDIEREVRFVLGGTPCVAYLDIVMDGSKDHGEGAEIPLDLKTGQTKPGAAELFMDDQVATYYLANGQQTEDFLMYYMNSESLLAIDRNHALIDHLPEMAEQDSLNIQAGHFPRAYDKQKCSWCPFSKECLGI